MPLDLQVLTLMGGDEKVTEEEMAEETAESSEIVSDI